MLWFKHDRNLRNSPSMKLIHRHLGDAGFAAAIRLLEVMTERSGSGTKFDPVLKLASPTTKKWLANEICTPDEDGDPYGTGGHVTDKQFETVLNTFHEAGLIRRGTVTLPGTAQNEKGEWVEGNYSFETIELCEFEEMQDTWTARHQHKGTGQGKGGGGYRAT